MFSEFMTRTGLSIGSFVFVSLALVGCGADYDFSAIKKVESGAGEDVSQESNASVYQPEINFESRPPTTEQGQSQTQTPSAGSSQSGDPVAPAPARSPLSYNFVAGDKATCEATIIGRLGASASCTFGGGCTHDGQAPSPSNLSANPGAWGACIIVHQ